MGEYWPYSHQCMGDHACVLMHIALFSRRDQWLPRLISISSTVPIVHSVYMQVKSFKLQHKDLPCIQFLR
jgi:hypothetical protein